MDSSSQKKRKKEKKEKEEKEEKKKEKEDKEESKKKKQKRKEEKATDHRSTVSVKSDLTSEEQEQEIEELIEELHDKVKPDTICEFCCKDLGRPQDLKRHLLVHTDERKFVLPHFSC